MICYLSPFTGGPLWSWSYGSWIYNYLYNQYLSPLGCEFEYRSDNRTLCDKVCQWLAAGQWFLLALRFPPLINWNIVESDVKPHNLTFYRIHIIYFSVNTVYSHPSIMLWCSVFSILLFLSQRLSTIDIYLHPSHLLTFPISITTVVKKGYGCKQTWDPTLL